MPRLAFPWAYQTNSGRARIASLERLVNLYPERSNSIVSSNSDATDIVILSAAGCRPKFDLKEDGQVVGLFSTDKELFAWTENALYQLFESNCTVKKLFSHSFGRIIAAYGDRTNAAGKVERSVWWTDGQQSFILNVLTGDVKPLSDDPSFLPASSTTYLDSIAIFSRRNQDEFFWSDVLDYDMFNGLNFASAEGFPDDIVRIMAFERELWIFGKQTIEIWTNTGNSQAQFRRLGNAFFETGCIDAHTIVKLTRDIYWISTDLRVMRNAAGSYNEEPVSLHQGVEHDLTTYGVEGIFAFGVSVEGHSQYWLTIPKAKRTWVFDESLNLWYERTSLNDGQLACNESGCKNKAYGRHKANAGVMHCETPYIGANGKVFELDLDYYKDDDELIFREATTSPLRIPGSDEVIYSKVELEFQNDCGFLDSSCDRPENEAVKLGWSDDFAKSWCEDEPRWITKDDPDYVPTWNGLGRSRARAFRWRTYWPGQIAFLRSVIYLTGVGRGG